MVNYILSVPAQNGPIKVISSSWSGWRTGTRAPSPVVGSVLKTAAASGVTTFWAIGDNGPACTNETSTSTPT